MRRKVYNIFIANSRNWFFLLVLFAAFSCSAQRTVPGTNIWALHNPVMDKDFPDPTIIHANGKYYGYATQSSVNGVMWNIQVASSTDLQNWKMENDALPQKPVWASNTQDFWAPHVIYDAGIKKYVLFFSAKSNDTATDKCIGVAFADAPTGPFTDKGSPLICGVGFVNIDPMALIDPATKKKLLYWGSGFQPIKVQELSDDWKSFKPASVATPLVWPGKEKKYTILLEGAWLDYAGGKYYLYYSGDNCCGDKASYAVMVARADNAMGPYTRMGEVNTSGSSVILEKDNVLTEPGHNSIFRDDKGEIWIAYHAVGIKKKVTGKGDARVLCISPVEYKNGWPVVIRN